MSQVLVAVGIISTMAGSSTVAYKAYGRSRIVARHNACDAHLGTVIAALDTFRQDNRRLPYSLAELVKRKYATAESLRCPADPHVAEHANDDRYTSYSNGYVLRDVLDSDQLPVLVCPYHDDDGGTGEQAFRSFYTKRYSVKPATLAAGDWGGVVTVTRAGRVLTLPESGDPPLVLQGGDHFSIGAGEATIHFADTSTANMVANTELTVLQSYQQKQQEGSLYTVVHQALGTVNYYVNPGSKFDVSTPTATAGAMGTRFTVIVRPVTPTPAYPFDTTTDLKVTEHKVAFTSFARTVMVYEGEPQITAGGAAFMAKPRRPRPAPSEGLISSSGGGTSPTPTPTTVPTPTPTPTDCPTPTPTPHVRPTPTPTPTTRPTPTPTPTTRPTPTPTPTGGGSNSGSTNSGSNNSGGTNSGSSNSGSNNSGGTNSGSNNSGGTNSGSNSGGSNSGSSNSGSSNSGGTNSGGTNSGGSNGGGSNGGITIIIRIDL